MEIRLSDVEKRHIDSGEVVKTVPNCVFQAGKISKLSISTAGNDDDDTSDYAAIYKQTQSTLSSLFKIDTKISNQSTRRHQSGTKERTLRKWSEHSNASFLESKLESSSTSNGWDQFAVNERLFGVRSTYDENLYTVAIDKTSKEYLRLESKADRIASEIMAGKGGVVHSDNEQDYDDEEAKFSSVVRSKLEPQASKSAGYDKEQTPIAKNAPEIQQTKAKGTKLNPLAKEFIPSQQLVSGDSYAYGATDYTRSSYFYPQQVMYYGTCYYPSPSAAYSAYPANYDPNFSYRNYSQSTPINIQTPRYESDASSDTAIIVSVTSNNSTESEDSSRTEHSKRN